MFIFSSNFLQNNIDNVAPQDAAGTFSPVPPNKVVCGHVVHVRFIIVVSSFYGNHVARQK